MKSFRAKVQVLIKSKDELNAQLHVIGNRPQPPEKKFLLFAYGRSGSELLRSLINSHPDIYCDEEIFLDRKALFPQRYLSNRAKIPQKKIYGYKAKLPQLELQYRDHEKLKATFLTKEFQIIYLRRKNFLRQALSVIIGIQRNKWHDTKAAPLSGKKFHVDCNELLERIRWIEIYENKEKEMLRGLDYLFIHYEEDLLDPQNHQKTLNKIFHFLRVDPVPVDTAYVRTSTKNLSDYIENYEEVVDVINNSKYSIFLND